MHNSIFQIIRTPKPISNLDELIQEEIDVTIFGTGFFISKKGDFLTAGHTFENEGLHNYAIVENKLLPIAIKKGNIYYKKDPNWIDYAIGKVEWSPLNYFNCNEGLSLTNGAILFLQGFTPIQEDVSYVGLIDEAHLNYGYFRLSSMLFDTAFGNIKNAFTISFSFPRNPHGMSGSPVFDDKYNLYGVFCSGKPNPYSQLIAGRVLKLSSLAETLKSFI